MREYRDIPGYAGRYQVSNDGKVRSLPRAGKAHRNTRRWLRQSACGGGGYRKVILCDATGHRTVMVHKLVALAFLPAKPSPKHVVHHRDGRRSNNRVANLVWATSAENNAAAVAAGHRRGERHYGAKLTEDAVRSIRAVDERPSVLAKRYGVTAGAICNIRSRRTWKHVEE